MGLSTSLVFAVLMLVAMTVTAAADFKITQKALIIDSVTATPRTYSKVKKVKVKVGKKKENKKYVKK